MPVAELSRRSVLAAAAALTPGLVRAQEPAPVPLVRVRMVTAAGPIVCEIETQRAPLTAANFLGYVDTNRFDDSAFYRASRAPGAPTVGLIEGGLQNDPKRLLPPVAHESTTDTGLRHTDGVLSMARNGPGTATADFFICIGPAAYLDADPSRPGDNLGYAAFGRVVEGMDVVRAILALPTPGVARNPVMQGQMLDPVVAIRTMRRVSA